MKKIKSSGGLSLLLMLTLLAPIAVIAQTTPPADEPVSSSVADAGSDARVAAGHGAGGAGCGDGRHPVAF
jgi:hypothetical protein